MEALPASDDVQETQPRDLEVDEFLHDQFRTTPEPKHEQSKAEPNGLDTSNPMDETDKHLESEPDGLDTSNPMDETDKHLESEPDGLDTSNPMDDTDKHLDSEPNDLDLDTSNPMEASDTHLHEEPNGLDTSNRAEESATKALDTSNPRNPMESTNEPECGPKGLDTSSCFEVDIDITRLSFTAAGGFEIEQHETDLTVEGSDQQKRESQVKEPEQKTSLAVVTVDLEDKSMNLPMPAKIHIGKMGVPASEKVGQGTDKSEATPEKSEAPCKKSEAEPEYVRQPIAEKKEKSRKSESKKKEPKKPKKEPSEPKEENLDKSQKDQKEQPNKDTSKKSKPPQIRESKEKTPKAKGRKPDKEQPKKSATGASNPDQEPGEKEPKKGSKGQPKKLAKEADKSRDGPERGKKRAADGKSKDQDEPPKSKSKSDLSKKLHSVSWFIVKH